MRATPNSPSTLTPLPTLVRRYAGAIPIGIGLWIVFRIVEWVTETQPKLPPIDPAELPGIPLASSIGCVVALLIALMCAETANRFAVAAARRLGRPVLAFFSHLFR